MRRALLAALLLLGSLSAAVPQAGYPVGPNPPAGLFNTTGALKGNGTGTVSQAASTDLSDTTAATTWIPTDQSGAALTFSSTAGSYYSKSNKTCVGMLRVVFPSTASGAIAAFSLPCTLPSSGVATTIGFCNSNASAPAIQMALVGLNNSTNAQLNGSTGSGITNVTLTTATLTCNFGFVSQ